MVVLPREPQLLVYYRAEKEQQLQILFICAGECVSRRPCSSSTLLPSSHPSLPSILRVEPLQFRQFRQLACPPALVFSVRRL